MTADDHAIEIAQFLPHLCARLVFVGVRADLYRAIGRRCLGAANTGPAGAPKPGNAIIAAAVQGDGTTARAALQQCSDDSRRLSTAEGSA